MLDKLLDMIPKLEFMIENLFSLPVDTIPVNRDAMKKFMTELMEAIMGATASTPKRENCKPALGCRPYHVAIAERIRELSDAIGRYSSEPGKSKQIQLWTEEIYMLNEIERRLRQREKEKSWIEKPDGTTEEI